MKSISVIDKLVLILITLSLASSQYDPHDLIYTGIGTAYSTAVSPINGDILVGGSGKIQRFDKDGYFLQQNTRHTGNVIAIFWTNDDIVSVGDNGQVIKWTPLSFNYSTSLITTSGVINADMCKNYLALNYGYKIDQYSVSTLNFNIGYTYLSGYSFYDLSYSKHDNGKSLYAINSGYRVKYSQGYNTYSQYPTYYTFYTIDTHPSRDTQIVNDLSGYLYQIDYSMTYTKYNDYYLMDNPKYSSSGYYVIASYVVDQIMIWDNNRKAVQNVDGWKCTIVALSQNYGVLSVVDRCGYLGILYDESDFSLPIWIIIIIVVIVIIIVSAIAVCIWKRRKQAERQRAQIGGYSNQSNQGFSPNNNNQGFSPNNNNYGYPNQNQGWNNNNNGNWGNQQNNPYNQYNQGFNNQNQGYQPPNKNW